MPDRENVIERLGKVSYYFKSQLAVGWQGDVDTYREHMESVNMAIELLKEQEPVKPEYKLILGSENIREEWKCGNCGYSLFMILNQANGYGTKSAIRYCAGCGRAVKWNG